MQKPFLNDQATNLVNFHGFLVRLSALAYKIVVYKVP